MFKYLLLGLSVFFALLSCEKKQSDLEVKCSGIVSFAEEFIKNLPLDLGESTNKFSLLENISNASSEAEYLDGSLFDCQTSLLAEGESGTDVRDSVLSVHMKVISIISILDTYKEKVKNVPQDELSDFMFRLNLNIKMIED